MPKPNEIASAIQPGDWGCLMAHSHFAVFPDGHVFFKEGETSRKEGRQIFVVYSGQVGISSTGADGRVPIVRTLSAGAIFGLVGFLTTEQHTATCQAVGETSLAVISADDLKRIQSASPEVYTRLLWACATQLAKDLRACNERLLVAMDVLTHK